MPSDRRHLLGSAFTLAGAGLLGVPPAAFAQTQPLPRPDSAPAAGPKAGVAPAVASLLSARYELAFGDDFDDPDLSRLNEDARVPRPGAVAWRSRYRHPRKDPINQEKQIYVDPQFAGTGDRPLGLQPFSIANGLLTISARRTDPVLHAPRLWNRAYTSGCLTSELTHWQTYGYFEMRARLPLGKGFWPAFWLMPKAEGWPPEIDVFEGSGSRPDQVFCNVIEKVPPPDEANSGWVRLPPAGPGGFRTFGMEWIESRITWFVDGRQVHQFRNHRIHQPMYLLMNLAVGSHDPTWIPDPDATTPFPGEFVVDYVRAFKRAGDA